MSKPVNISVVTVVTVMRKLQLHLNTAARGSRTEMGRQEVVWKSALSEVRSDDCSKAVGPFLTPDLLRQVSAC